MSYFMLRIVLPVVNGPAEQTHLDPWNEQVTGGSPAGRTIVNCWSCVVDFHSIVSWFFFSWIGVVGSIAIPTPGVTVTDTSFGMVPPPVINCLLNPSQL